MLRSGNPGESAAAQHRRSMDTIRIARQVRALRRRRGWRQDDLAISVGVSRGVVARIEQGHADRVTVATLERLVGALGARMTCRLDWNGEALDRLLDADHATIVDRVVRILSAYRWVCTTEASFNIAGERGSIDILGWHPTTKATVVVEVKSVVPDVQATLMALDRKARLGARIARERGWEPGTISRLLVIREDRTARRRVAAHEATFATVFPDRAVAVRRWIAQPHRSSPIAGLWFLSGDHQTVARHRVAKTRLAGERGFTGSS
jgi:transcriptional regulator with XRE-family HTH domain